MEKVKKPADWFVIGIGGVTCGGKTTLANKLCKSIFPCYLLHQDTYFFPDDYEGHVKCDGLDHNNYDILSSLDMPRMYNDMLSIFKGQTQNITVDVTLNQPAEQVSYTFPQQKILIVEGFSVLNYRKIFKLCDIKYFLTLEFGECLARRVFRTYDPPDIPGYFEQVVWPNYLNHKQELENDTTVNFLDGAEGAHFDMVIAELKELGLLTIESAS